MEEGGDIEIVCIRSEDKSKRKHKKKRSHSDDEDREKSKKKRYENEDLEKEDNSSDIIELQVYRKKKRKKRRRSTSYCSDDEHKHIKQEKKKDRIKEEILVDSDIEITRQNNNYSRKEKRKKKKRRRSSSYCSDDEYKHINKEKKKERLNEEIIVDSDIEIENFSRNKSFNNYKKDYSQLNRDYSSSSHRKKDYNKDNDKKVYSDKYVDENKKERSKFDYRQDEREQPSYENEKGRYERNKYSKMNINNEKGHKYPSDAIYNREKNTTSDSPSDVDILKRALKRIGSNGNERVGTSSKNFHENSGLNEVITEERHKESMAGSSSSLYKNTEDILRWLRNMEEESATNISPESQLTRSKDNEIHHGAEIDIITVIRSPEKHQENNFPHRQTDHSLPHLGSRLVNVSTEPQKNNLNSLHTSLTKNTSNQISRISTEIQELEHHFSRKSKPNQEHQGQTSSHVERFSYTERHNPAQHNNLEQSLKMKSSSQKEKLLPLKKESDIGSILDKFPNIQKQMELASRNKITSSSTNAMSSGTNTVTDAVVNKKNIANTNPSKSSSKQLPYKNLAITSQEEIILSDSENSPVIFHNAANCTLGIAKQGNKNNLVGSTEHTIQHNKSIKISKQGSDHKLDNIENSSKQKGKEYNHIDNTNNSLNQNKFTNNLNSINPSQDLLSELDNLQSVSDEKRPPTQVNTANIRVSQDEQQQSGSGVDKNKSRGLLNPTDQFKRRVEAAKVKYKIKTHLLNTKFGESNDQNITSEIQNTLTASDNCGKLFTIDNVQGNISFNDENISANELNKFVLQTSDMQTSSLHVRNEKESNIIDSNIYSENEEKQNSRVYCIKDEIVTMNEIHSEVYDQVDSKAFVRTMLNNDYLENFESESKVILHKNIRSEGLISDHLGTGCDKNIPVNLAQAEENLSTQVPGNECINKSDSEVNFAENEDEMQSEIENSLLTVNENPESDNAENEDEMQHELENSLLEDNENPESTNDMNFNSINNKNTTKNNLYENQPSSSQNQFNMELTNFENVKNINMAVITSHDSVPQQFSPESSTINRELPFSDSPMFQIENVWSTAIASQDNSNHYPIPEDLAEVVEIGRVEVTKISACSFKIKKENQDERNYYVAHTDIECCPMCQRKLDSDQFKFNPTTMIHTMVCFCTLTIYQLLNPEKYKTLRVR